MRKRVFDSFRIPQLRFLHFHKQLFSFFSQAFESFASSQLNFRKTILPSGRNLSASAYGELMVVAREYVISFNGLEVFLLPGPNRMLVHGRLIVPISHLQNFVSFSWQFADSLLYFNLDSSSVFFHFQKPKTSTSVRGSNPDPSVCVHGQGWRPENRATAICRSPSLWQAFGQCKLFKKRTR